MKRQLCLAALLVCQAITHAGLAQPQAVSLPEVLRLLRSRSPAVAALRANVEVARSSVVEASIHPNPTLSWSMLRPLSGTDTTAGTQNTVVYEQPILVGGQREKRRAAAERGTLAAEAQVEADTAELSREARHRFVTLLAAQERLRLRSKTGQRLEEVQRVVSGRSESGASSNYDSLRVEAEVAVVGSEAMQASAAVDDAAGQLAVLVGLSGWRPRAEGKLESFGIDPGSRTLAGGAVERLPAVRAKRAETGAAQAVVEASRRQAWPTPSLSVGALTTSAPGGLAGIVGVSLPLPFFDRSQGAVARARAELSRAELELRAAEAQTEAELLRALRVLAARRRALAGFDQRPGARVPALEQMGEDAYRLGKASILELLDALRTIAYLRQQRMTLVEDLMHAEIDAAYAAGRPELAGGA